MSVLPPKADVDLPWCVMEQRKRIIDIAAAGRTLPSTAGAALD
jgi:hypothetical protein